MENLQNLNWSNKRPPLRPELQLQQFDKDFNEEKDILFYMVNEIEPIFMHEDDSEYNAENSLYIDPRTNIVATEAEIDHSKTRICPKLFSRFLSKSLLSKNDQASCSIYFILKKTNQKIPDKIRNDFNRTKFQRQKDQENFVHFLKKFCETQFHYIYNPGKFLHDYTTILCTKMNEKLLQSENIMYQILTAFPMPNKFSETQLTLNNIETISKSGQIPLYKDLNLNVLKPKFETYFNSFVQKLITPKETSNILTKCENNLIDIFLPNESLLFLLAIAEETDTHSQMHFQIYEKNYRKYVLFEKPLPSKNASLETNTYIFEKTFQSFLSMTHLLPWFKIHPDSLEGVDTTVEETLAMNYSGIYKLQNFEEFLAKYESAKEDVQIKSNEFLVKCTLGEGENLLQILTSCQASFCKENENNMSFINSSIKLEYKAQFGCEILTLYELLKEWINQKFIPNSQTFRHRVDIQSFRTIEHQTVTLEEIEHEIEKNHKIDLSKFLGALHHFLSLTKSLPPQKYLLRHSSKHPGKIMVYNEFSEETGLSLHSIATEENDKLMTFKAPFIPIDDTVYTEMHQKNRIIPCSFPPWVSKYKTKIVNDRDHILETVKSKQEQIELIQKMKKSNSKHRKRAAKRSQKKKVESEKILDEITMKKDIENDIKLFGYSSSDENLIKK